MLIVLAAFALLQGSHRTVAIDERLAADAGISLNSIVVLSATSGAVGDTATVSAIVRRRADPSEVARGEYRVRTHLGQLQRLLDYGDRVDRFAVQSRTGATTDSVMAAINRQAFGFRAHRSADIAVQTSRTFQVVSRFHRAIGVITIVAGAVFLLCIMLLKVEERRREIATLRLIGISRRSIIRSVSLEAALVALTGSLTGGVLGVIISGVVNSYYQGVYRTPMVFAMVTPAILLFSVCLSIALGVAAGALVSYRMVRMPPLHLLGR